MGKRSSCLRHKYYLYIGKPILSSLARRRNILLATRESPKELLESQQQFFTLCKRFRMTRGVNFLAIRLEMFHPKGFNMTKMEIY